METERPMKSASEVKEPVRLREKKLAGGVVSLYLDTYIGNGRRKYEFLKLYLVPEASRADKERNKETLSLAKAIRAKRIVELRNGLYGLDGPKGSTVRFFDYFKAVAGRRSENTRSSWRSCLAQLMAYEKRLDITMADITPSWVRGFGRFLEREAVNLNARKEGAPPLSQNTQFLYFSKLRTCLKAAYRERVLADDVLRGVESMSPKETERQFLTLDEVRLLSRTACGNEAVRRAFLFSCLTGLRISDVKALTWGNVSLEDGLTRITFRQQKTGGQEYLDIAPEAAALLGERSGDSDRPFATLPGLDAINNALSTWTKRAGIPKHITYHCSRHTFAVMMLSLGTDIYTVSKLLGHRDISTTQVYAKVLDKTKRDAVRRIPGVLSDEKN